MSHLEALTIYAWFTLGGCVSQPHTFFFPQKALTGLFYWSCTVDHINFKMWIHTYINSKHDGLSSSERVLGQGKRVWTDIPPVQLSSFTVLFSANVSAMLHFEIGREYTQMFPGITGFSVEAIFFCLIHSEFWSILCCTGRMRAVEKIFVCPCNYMGDVITSWNIKNCLPEVTGKMSASDGPHDSSWVCRRLCLPYTGPSPGRVWRKPAGYSSYKHFPPPFTLGHLPGTGSHRQNLPSPDLT